MLKLQVVFRMLEKVHNSAYTQLRPTAASSPIRSIVLTINALVI